MVTNRDRAKFPKSFRLRNRDEFQSVFAARSSASNPIIIVYAAPNGLARSRIGLVVSRKVGSAVVRNKWKRRIREVFRVYRHRFPVGFDFVVLPRGKQPAQFETLGEQLPTVASQAARRAQRKSPPSSRGTKG